MGLKQATLAIALACLACGMASAASLTGPAHASVAQSGYTSDLNWGYATGVPWAVSYLNKMADDDDCDRELHSDQFGEVEWTWTLDTGDTQPRIVHIIAYYAGCDAFVYTDVDNLFDCDFASAAAHVKVKNDDSGESYHDAALTSDCTNPPSELENEGIEAVSGQYTSPCVQSGSQFSCHHMAAASSYIKSEAVAHADSSPYQPAVSYEIHACP